MVVTTGNNDTTNTTSYKVVLPFYGYASIAFLLATILLLKSVTHVNHHYFQPDSLAIVHIMTLGWGTMMILGASYQLVPVLTENRLYSIKLAYTSFITAGVGIPLLVNGFYYFDMGFVTRCGAILICLSVIAYLINLGTTMARSGQENVHAVFVFTATVWLLVTVIIGTLLVYNFTYPIFPKDFLDYLPLHAHMGIAGWFLLLITGVGTRLIPMFLISKYDAPKRLWWIYGLINGALLVFIVNSIYPGYRLVLITVVLAFAVAIGLFINYCYRSYQLRIRRTVDAQMKMSLLSVGIMAVPVLLMILIITLVFLSGIGNLRLAVAYGFVILFGWLTAIILGMTFKTLPFIIWNKTYHHLAGKGKVPNPKDLFSHVIFRVMMMTYITGVLLFTAGLILNISFVLHIAGVLLVITSVLYNWNVIKLLFHKPVKP